MSGHYFQPPQMRKQRGGFRQGLAKRALARDSRTDHYDTETSLHPKPGKVRKHYRMPRGKDISSYSAFGLATMFMLSALGGAASQAGGEHAVYDPCDGQPAYFGDGEWNVTYKEGEKHRWFLQGGMDYYWPGNSGDPKENMGAGDLRLKPNACVDHENPVAPAVLLSFYFKKDKVPNIKELDKEVDCGHEFPNYKQNKIDGYNCIGGIKSSDPPIDFDGTVTKIEKGLFKVDEDLYTPVINVSIEAEGPVNGIKISDGKPENNLLLPLTAAGIAAGLGISGLVYKQRKKKPSEQEIVGRTKTGEPVYGK